jgi:hypothetical protein
VRALVEMGCSGCQKLPGCSVVARLAEVAQPRWSYVAVAWSLERWQQQMRQLPSVWGMTTGESKRLVAR